MRSARGEDLRLCCACADGGNVVIEWNHVLDEVLGDDSGVTGMRIRDVSSGTTSDKTLRGVFIAIGHQPNTDIFKGWLGLPNLFIVDFFLLE